MTQSQPTALLEACPQHCPAMANIFETGPEAAEQDMDVVQAALMCWRCWESDLDKRPVRIELPPLHFADGLYSQ